MFIQCDICVMYILDVLYVVLYVCCMSVVCVLYVCCVCAVCVLYVPGGLQELRP